MILGGKWQGYEEGKPSPEHIEGAEELFIGLQGLLSALEGNRYNRTGVKFYPRLAPLRLKKKKGKSNVPRTMA